MKNKPSIGRAESEALRFIAEAGGASVTQVGDHLAETKGQTRSTALNMMERLRTKGFLDRKKVDGIYLYSPTASKGRVLDGFVDDFVDKILGGSTSPLVAYLGRRAEVDEDQLRQLKALVKNLEERQDA